MTSHRLALLLVGVTSVATLAPRTTSAQIVSATTQVNSHAWLKNECMDMACIRALVQNNVALKFVPVGASADLFARAEAFIASTDLSSFIADCSACRVTNRPFIIPPGLMFQLALDHGNGSAASSNGKSQSGGSGGDNSDGGGLGNVPIFVPANGGVGGSNSESGGAGGTPASAAAPVSGAPVGGAPAAEVTTNPEPATFALMATGLLGLVPVIRRTRRNR